MTSVAKSYLQEQPHVTILEFDVAEWVFLQNLPGSHSVPGLVHTLLFMAHFLGDADGEVMLLVVTVVLSQIPPAPSSH